MYSMILTGFLFFVSFSEFRSLSHDLLDKCYRECESKTVKLITEQSEQFNKRTSIDMAVSMMHLEFVSHSCVQALLNDVWTGM